MAASSLFALQQITSLPLPESLKETLKKVVEEASKEGLSEALLCGQVYEYQEALSEDVEARKGLVVAMVGILRSLMGTVRDGHCLEVFARTLSDQSKWDVWDVLQLEMLESGLLDPLADFVLDAAAER